MALSRRKSKDLLLDGRMRPYQNSIAYQKEKGKDFFSENLHFFMIFPQGGRHRWFEVYLEWYEAGQRRCAGCPARSSPEILWWAARSCICRTSSVCPMPFSRRMRRIFSPMGMVGDCLIFGSILPPCRFSFYFREKQAEKQEKAPEKQIPLKKTLFFWFMGFLRGIATTVFRRKHTR